MCIDTIEGPETVPNGERNLCLKHAMMPSSRIFAAFRRSWAGCCVTTTGAWKLELMWTWEALCGDEGKNRQKVTTNIHIKGTLLHMHNLHYCIWMHSHFYIQYDNVIVHAGGISFPKDVSEGYTYHWAFGSHRLANQLALRKESWVISCNILHSSTLWCFKIQRIDSTNIRDGLRGTLMVSFVRRRANNTCHVAGDWVAGQVFAWLQFVLASALDASDGYL